MNQPLLIIITGSPGAGKTSLGQQLAKQYGLPFLYKDGIREVLFDSLGIPKTKPELDRLRTVNYKLLYYFLDQLGQAKQSVIIESNFINKYDAPPINKLINKHQWRVIQIVCYADGQTLINRFLDRIKSGERHPGHNDLGLIPEPGQPSSADDLTSEYQLQKHRLDLLGQQFELDMTDFTQINREPITQAIQNYLGLTT